MAATQYTGDFRVVGTVGGDSPVTRVFDVVAGAAASIAIGDLVIVDGSNPGYVAKAGDGASSTSSWVGMAVSNSTDTALADGTVEIMFHPSGLVVRGTPDTPGNLAQAIIDTQVTLEMAAADQEIDENDTSNGVLTIVTYDSTSGNETIDVVVPFNLQ